MIGASNDALTVSQVNRRIESVLAEAFDGSFWVTGELLGYDRDAVKADQRRWGQVYFELIEKSPGSDAVKAGARAILWGDAHRAVRAKLAGASRDLRLQDGLQVRFLCAVDFYWPRATLQLKVLDVDPHFTLGDMERARRELLAALAREGLLDANRQCAMPLVPLNVGLVTAEGSAAYHDFVRELQSSGYAFRVFLAESAMQGAETEPGVRRALTALGHREEVDVVVVVRGGGSRSDLIWFDREGVARAIAVCPKPVLTGIGHEIDESVADRVAHAHVKTPTAAAQFLVERVRNFESAVAEGASRLIQGVRDRLVNADDALRDLSRTLQNSAIDGVERWRRDLDHLRITAAAEARRRLDVTREQLSSFPGRVQRSVKEPLKTHADRLTDWRRKLGPWSRAGLARAEERLESLKRSAAAQDPRRLLSRGYSLAWVEGRLLKTVTQAIPGTSIRLELADGDVRAVVSEEV
jgi:exodeoxyribonuclease VII large subunit